MCAPGIPPLPFTLPELPLFDQVLMYSISVSRTLKLRVLLTSVNVFYLRSHIQNPHRMPTYLIDALLLVITLQNYKLQRICNSFCWWTSPTGDAVLVDKATSNAALAGSFLPGIIRPWESKDKSGKITPAKKFISMESIDRVHMKSKNSFTL